MTEYGRYGDDRVWPHVLRVEVREELLGLPVTAACDGIGPRDRQAFTCVVNVY